MSDAPEKPMVAKPRLAKPLSMTVAGNPSYRVSKTQAARMRAYDLRLEAAEAKKAKAAEAKKARTEARTEKQAEAMSGAPEE